MIMYARLPKHRVCLCDAAVYFNVNYAGRLLWS